MNKNMALYCVPRSGSSSLFSCITEHLDKTYVSIWEPFNIAHENMKKENPLEIFNYIDRTNGDKNMFLKLMIGQKKHDTSQLAWDSFIFTKIPKILFLIREDKKAATESLLFHQTIKETNYHSKKYYDLSLINNVEMEIRTAGYEFHEKIAKIYNKNYGYPIFTYEEIFVDKNMDRIYEIFEYFEIKPNDDLIKKYIISDEFKVKLGNIEDKPKNKLL
jgi:hypothetical protein